MRKIDVLLNEYGQSHKNSTNKIIHWICVPLITFSLIGLLWTFPLSSDIRHINFATFFVIFALAYYFYLSKLLMLAMLQISIIFFFIIHNLSIQLGHEIFRKTMISIFIVSWLAQFIGHKIEGKKPSFFKDLQFLLIAPLWLLHFLFKKNGFKY